MPGIETQRGTDNSADRPLWQPGGTGRPKSQMAGNVEVLGLARGLGSGIGIGWRGRREGLQKKDGRGDRVELTGDWGQEKGGRGRGEESVSHAAHVWTSAEGGGRSGGTHYQVTFRQVRTHSRLLAWRSFIVTT